MPSRESSINQAAAFVIGNIITRRKSALIDRIFLSTIIDTIRPKALPKDVNIDINSINTIVLDVDLETALARLALLASYPNPAFTVRLLKPLYIALWGIYTFAKKSKKGYWQEISFTLLKSYIKLSTESKEIAILAENLLYSGSSGWAYANGDFGGIEIREANTDDGGSVNPEEIDQRVEAFMDVLENIDPSHVSHFFLDVLKKWLRGNRGKHENSVEEDPLR